MPSGLFFSPGRERRGALRTTRGLRAGPAAGTGLFRNLDTTGGRTVLARLRRHTRSALDTPGSGTLDHPGGTVGHGSGTTGNHRGTGTLPPRHDRRDRGSRSHRTPVTRADPTWAGDVRRTGETADLRLVGILATTRVPTAARLTGRAWFAGLRLAPAADVAVGSGLATRLHEPVRAGVRAGLDESV
ncbi:hypothetical protein [Actinoplanes sp. G11-F43]|uniref:hypothetical protein n=1 Tax=Actinoplanes sp. G11-F43 TaxID=3424130 RepID=UPI003D3387AB